MNSLDLVVVPTAHVSRESARRVSRAIRQAEPDVVALELCPSRLGALLSNRKPTLSELVRNPLFAVLYSLQRLFGWLAGAEPGVEMLAAIHAASSSGASLAAVDREVSETLRLLSKIPLREKLNALFSLLPSILFFSIKRHDAESFVSGSFAASLLREFRASFPFAYWVLVGSRDEVMASNISRFSGTVVLVIGAGHARGVVSRLRRKLGGRLAVSFA